MYIYIYKHTYARAHTHQESGPKRTSTNSRTNGRAFLATHDLANRRLHGSESRVHI